MKTTFSSVFFFGLDFEPFLRPFHSGLGANFFSTSGTVSSEGVAIELEVEVSETEEAEVTKDLEGL